MPTWHGPPPEDYREIGERLSVLNGNLLFDTERDAEEFKAYYKYKPWAETEDHKGEFCIIQVEAVGE